MMYTPRKKYLRKKRAFVYNEQTFAIFNASNLKTSKIEKIKLLSKSGKLYFVPLYLMPPKQCIGCPIIMIMYSKLQDLKEDILYLSSKMNCIGVSIQNKWYSTKYFEKKKIKNLSIKTLALLLFKVKLLHNKT
uniref:Uncharacterized protein n=1 Tax=Fucus distichus TaxID=3012 RepID=A0A343C622_FUCDI|nr:hypothetical protein [Fucus distichus]ARI50025.1 hypothetical protein [Fucus distichus]